VTVRVRSDPSERTGWLRSDPVFLVVLEYRRRVCFTGIAHLCNSKHPPIEGRNRLT
jgi:hypothetical protein